MPIPTQDPIVTVPVVTPFDSKDRVDLAAVERNVRAWMTTPLSGFLVGSQSGEEWSLSEDEKLEVAATVAASLDGERFLIGGVDCPSVLETLRRVDAFAARGAEMVRIRFPRETELVEPYLQEVSQRSSLPILLMHQCAPERFGLAAAPAASAERIGAVCELDGIFGYVTDHDLRFEARVRQFVPQHVRFWICNGSLALAGTFIGCNGITTAFSNIWPEALDTILRHGMAGHYEEARALQRQVEEIDSIMLPYRAAGVKAAMNLRGWDGTHARSPSRTLTDAELNDLQSTMARCGLIQE